MGILVDFLIVLSVYIIIFIEMLLKNYFNISNNQFFILSHIFFSSIFLLILFLNRAIFKNKWGDDDAPSDGTLIIFSILLPILFNSEAIVSTFSKNELHWMLSIVLISLLIAMGFYLYSLLFDIKNGNLDENWRPKISQYISAIFILPYIGLTERFTENLFTSNFGKDIPTYLAKFSQSSIEYNTPIAVTYILAAFLYTMIIFIPTLIPRYFIKSLLGIKLNSFIYFFSIFGWFLTRAIFKF
ncbi:hypothetical protein JXR93_09500 [bacterium]|nr:hypothetical protein [bacterium]